MTRRAWPLVVLAVVLAGCAAPAPEPSTRSIPNAVTPGSPVPIPPSSSPSSGSSSEPPTSAEPSTPPESSGSATSPQRITLAFAGDVHFERQLAPRLRDSDEAWSRRLPELAAADFAMVNLETAITERGRPASKAYTFRAPAAALAKLKAAGVDAVSMANNHAADFGRQGVEDTLAAVKDSPIPVVGFGADERQAYAPATFDVRGVKVGVISSMEIPEQTYANWSAGPDSAGVAQNVRRDRFTRAAQDAVANHDLVIAFLHWGTEGSTCPNERQIETARILRDTGVDVIVGTHAHRPQGSGWDGRAFVGYGTGNFIWYNTSAGSRSSGILTVSVDADAARARGAQDAAARANGPGLVRSYEWTPKVIAPGGLPETPTTSRPRLERAAQNARSCSGLAQSPQ